MNPFSARLPALMSVLRPDAPSFVLVVFGPDDISVIPLNPASLARGLAVEAEAQQSPRLPAVVPEGLIAAGATDTAATIQAGPLHLDPEARLFLVSGIPLALTTREFDLMAFLMAPPGRCRSRDEILDAVWGIDYDTGTNIVDVKVYDLRRKLARHGLRGCIETVRGVGYRLVVPESANPRACPTGSTPPG